MTRGGIVRGETLPRTCVSGRIRRLRRGSCAPRPSRDGHIRPELESATFQIFSTRCTHVREPTPSLTRRRPLPPTTQPVATVALFGKKPAAKKPPAKKPLVKKAAPKPIAKKKPVAKKAAAKKPAAKSFFSFGSSKPKPAGGASNADANAKDAQKWIDNWKGSAPAGGADTPEGRAAEAQAWIDAWKAKQ